MRHVSGKLRRAALFNSVGTSGVLIALSLCLEPAAAQQADSSSEARRLGEVVVTAQRKSESLQDVPVAVTVLSEAALEKTNISSITDLGTVVPSLTITNTNGKLSTSLRGIGSTGVGPGFENPVAIYVDGVFLAASIAPFLGLSDVAQVDVLKGPQGTLFGRNATGGLVQVTTRTPTQEAALSASVGYGNYDTIEGSFYLAGGLAPGVAASISAFGLEQGEGYGKNRTTGQDTYKVDYNTSVRAKLALDLGPSTKAVLSADYTDESRNDLVGIALPGTISPFTGAVVPDIGYDQISNAATYKDSWAAGTSLTIDQDIGDLTMKSITAYRESEASLGIDPDLTPIPILSSTYQQPEDQFSQEFQVQPLQTGKLSWVAGVYYFLYHGGYDAIRIPEFGVTTVNYQRAESVAGYAQATYEIFPDTNATLGGRYTSEKRTEYNGGVPERDLTFDEFTYRVSLDHRFNEDVLGYVSINRGFKSGGFNTSTPGLAPFRPETVDAFEIGLKTDLFDRRARLNIASYYYDYTDIQNFIFVTPTAVSVQNAASADVYGVDADFEMKVSSRLDVSGGIGLSNPKYGSYPNAPIGSPTGGTPPVTGSADGNYLPLASEFTANLAATYTVPLSSGDLALSVNGSHNSGYYFEADNVAKQPQFTLLGAHAKWTPGNEKVSFEVFVRNLTDEKVIAHSTTSAGGNVSFVLASPRIYGAKLGYTF